MIFFMNFRCYFLPWPCEANRCPFYHRTRRSLGGKLNGECYCYLNKQVWSRHTNEFYSISPLAYLIPPFSILNLFSHFPGRSTSRVVEGDEFYLALCDWNVMEIRKRGKKEEKKSREGGVVKGTRDWSFGFFLQSQISGKKCYVVMLENRYVDFRVGT